MRNEVVRKLESEIKSLMAEFSNIYLEADALDSAYNDTNASTLVGALILSTDGATLEVESNLTKGEYQGMITVCQQIYKMFTNQAVTTADYSVSVNKTLYGTSGLSLSIGKNVDELGTRLQALAWQMYSALNKSRSIYNRYFDNEVSAIVSNLNSGTILPDSIYTASDWSSAITLITDYIDFMTNAAVTTSDYKATLNKWLTN